MNTLQIFRLKLRQHKMVLRLLSEITMAVMSTGCGLSSQLETTDFVVDVPFTNESNTVIVEATVNGAGPYRFLLDSGAPTLFTRTLAEELGLTATRNAAINDVNSIKQATTLVTADSLSIGGLVVNQVDAAILDNPELACLANGGILGANVMKHGAWSIDFERQRVLASNDVTQLNLTSSETEWLPFTTQFGKDEPYVEMIINGESVSVEIDTGSNREIGITTATYQKVTGQDLSGEITGHGLSSIGLAGRTPETSYRSRLQSVTLGSHEYLQVEAQIKEVNTNRVGTQFFKGQRLIIDWTTDRIAVIGAPDNNRPQIAEYGVSLLGDADGVYVGYVWEGSAADKARLTPGMRVTAINDEPVTALAPCYAAPPLQDVEGPLVLTTLTDGRSSQVVLNKTQLGSE